MSEYTDHLAQMQVDRMRREEQRTLNAPVTAKVLKDAVREHARDAKPVNGFDSYFAVAQRVGYLALTLAAGWMLFDAPGVDELSGFSGNDVAWWFADHTTPTVLLVSLVLLYIVWEQSNKARSSVAFLCWRVRNYLWEACRTLVLLVGVATVGISGVVPAAWAVQHLHLC